MNNKLLEYQELDKKLKRIKKENATSQVDQNVVSLNNIIKDSQNKILELEETSKKLLASLEKLMEVEKKGVAFVEKYKKMNIEKMSFDELKDFETKVAQTSKQLAELENRIAQHNEEVKKVVLDYKTNRKKILDAKEKRDQIKVQTEAKPQNADPEVEGIKKEMAELEKQIEPTKLAKYKALKQDGIFPVIVALSENRCGGCRVQLSSSALDKLKSGAIYECEQCHRIIYIKDEK